MHRSPRFRPSPAMVVATIALLVALGGTGYAATVLPANSVGTVQVIDNSLLKKDFKAGQLPVGKPGPAGPSDAYAQSISGQITLPTSTTILATLQIPKPGSYLIWAKTDVSDTGSLDEAASCQLAAGNATDTSRTYLPKTGSSATISNLLVQQFSAAGQAQLNCVSGAGKVKAQQIELVSVRVASLAGS
jgi:hypothetical protein